MAKQDIKVLLERAKNGGYTPQEEAILKKWLFHLGQSDRLNFSEAELEIISNQIWAAIDPVEQQAGKVWRLWVRYAAAAILIVALGTGSYFLMHSANQTEQSMVQTDIAPGSNLAILTLNNGKKVSITGQKNEGIAHQGAVNIRTDANGKLNYNIVSAKPSDNLTFNTLTTPLASSMEITLSDHTEVILDAGSSITYPVQFGAGERVVSVTGQAYFKVKHETNRLFKVKAGKLIITDLGTEFNVNAYKDEKGIRTSLVSGSIKVNDLALVPGQLATAADGKITVSKADIEAITAWKDGNFLFRDQSLQTTMRQIARWYNVTVTYDNQPVDFRVWADISRKRNLSVILKSIEETGKVRFKVTGRNILVTQ